jgi:hypothetical protein
LAQARFAFARQLRSQCHETFVYQMEAFSSRLLQFDGNFRFDSPIPTPFVDQTGFLGKILLAVLFASARPIAAGLDGVIMQGGKVMMTAGKAIDPMTASMTMSNGAVVMPDGTVRLPGG